MATTAKSDKTHSFEDILNILASNDSTKIKETVKTLAKSKDFSNELIELLDPKKQDPNKAKLAPVWAIVILSERQDKNAIPHLFELLRTESGESLICIAAYDGLQKLSKTNAEEIYKTAKETVVNFLKERDEVKDSEKWVGKNSEFPNRNLYYDLIGEFYENTKLNKEVKTFLIEQAIEDYPFGGRIAQSLIRFELENATSFFRRIAEMSLLAYGGNAQYNKDFIDAKVALIYYTKGLTGKNYPKNKKESQTWEEKFASLFDLLDKMKAKEEGKPEDPKKEHVHNHKHNDREHHEHDHAHDEEKPLMTMDEFVKFEMPEFSLNEYQATVGEFKWEKEIDEVLKQLPEKKDFTAKKLIEELALETDFITNVSAWSEKLGLNVKDDKIKKEDTEKILNTLYTAWLWTPQETLGGLTPMEKQFYQEKVKKPGRNDACPCGAVNADGSPKKYKKCCGKRLG